MRFSSESVSKILLHNAFINTDHHFVVIEFSVKQGTIDIRQLFFFSRLSHKCPTEPVFSVLMYNFSHINIYGVIAPGFFFFSFLIAHYPFSQIDMEKFAIIIQSFHEV